MIMENPPLTEDLDPAYRFDMHDIDGVIKISPDSVILHIMEDVLQNISIKEMSIKFHKGLIKLFLNICAKINEKTKLETVALSGGCFQNRFLLEHLHHHLTKSGFDVLTHSQVPANDGGISLGQAVIGANQILKSRK